MLELAVQRVKKLLPPELLKAQDVFIPEEILRALLIRSGMKEAAVDATIERILRDGI